MVEVYDNRPQIKKDFKGTIEVKKHHQLQELQDQIKIVKEAKERFVQAHKFWKREENELKQLTRDSKELDINLRAYVTKAELKTEERKTNCEHTEKIVNIEKQNLKNLIKKHKEEIQAIKKKMFLVLEQERERIAREKAVMESM